VVGSAAAAMYFAKLDDSPMFRTQVRLEKGARHGPPAGSRFIGLAGGLSARSFSRTPPFHLIRSGSLDSLVAGSGGL
jgi:hypothetical protein